MAITTKQQRRSETLQLIADAVPPTDAATQLTVKWGCSRRTSLRDIELAQSELATALDSSELRNMVGWMATQYQRLATKAERDGQYAAACGCLNSLRVMLVQPQLDRQFEAHFRGRFIWMLSWSRVWLLIWLVTFLNINIDTYTKGDPMVSIKIQEQPRFMDKG